MRRVRLSSRCGVEPLEGRRLLSGTPYLGHPFAVGVDRIEAENFDNGGQGISYFDTTPGNHNGQYRATDVDINTGANSSNGYSVGYTAPGEWLTYTINASSAGTFALQAAVACQGTGGTFHVEIDGSNVTGSLSVPNTGPWDTWQVVSSPAFQISAGTHVMKVSMDRNGSAGCIGDFDDFNFVPVSAPTRTPYLGHPFNIATDTIEAENFDNGGQNVSYLDTTPGNHNGYYRNTDVDINAGSNDSDGYSVGYTAPGEWLDYTITAPAAGGYQLVARVASQGAGGTFHVEIDGTNVTGSLSVPNTGPWDTWKDVASGTFQVSAGTHTMRVFMERTGPSGAIGDFDNFRFQSAAQPPNVTYTWSNAHVAPVPVAEAETAAVGGKLYVFGGYSITSPTWLGTTAAESYDPSTDTWASLAPTPVPFTHGGCAADDRYVYLAGGYISNYATGYQTFATTNVWKYDTVLNQWSSMPPLPAARGAGGLVLLNGTLHFFGGVNASRVDQATHWTLDLSNPAAGWQTAAPLPSIRNHMGATVLNGKIYAIGGQVGENDSNPIATCLAWDPASGQWSSIANLPAPRSHIAADTFVLGNLIVVVGGISTGGGTTAAVTAYDPATGQWSQLPAIPTPLHSAVSRFIDGRIIVSTGYENALRNQTFVSSLIGS